ncbi:MAG: hypothetical protein IPK13_23610 [Deltaproteobacteria bacterium]|nr:hypothetical protein [Deltaproteobacteria bacterium]
MLGARILLKVLLGLAFTAFGVAGIHLYREGQSEASLACIAAAFFVIAFYLATRHRFGLGAEARFEEFLGTHDLVPEVVPEAATVPVAKRFAQFFFLGRAGRNTRAYHARTDEKLRFFALTFDGAYRNEVGLLPSLYALHRPNPIGRTSAHFMLAKDTNRFAASLGQAKLKRIKLHDGLRLYFDPDHAAPTREEIASAQTTLFHPSEDEIVVYQRSVEWFEDSEILYDAHLDQIGASLRAPDDARSR